MRYRVSWKYQSGLGGPWSAGEVLEMDPASAEAINRDSPGVLVPASAQALPDSGGGQEPGEGTRQVKAARTRHVAKAGADR